VALVQGDTILQEWDSMPSVITHGGEDRTGAIVGAEFAGGALLLERVLDAAPPSGNPPVTGQTSVVSGSRVVVTRSYGAIDLAPIKASLKQRIDIEAENARLKYITPGSGQALEYREAADEATRWAELSGQGVYPMLQASVDAGEAPNLAAAAAMISQRENAYAIIGATIRRLRLSAKRAVDEATDVATANAAAVVEWP
jgi:hypothetical protein